MQKQNIQKQKGFTLLELLVVIAIMGVLASVTFATTIRGLEQSRDTRRIQELYQIVQGLHLYYSVYETYPVNEDLDDPNCSIHGITWDAGNSEYSGDNFIQPLVDEDFLTPTPKEWMGTIINGNECVYRYARVENPCGCEGTYAILYGACEGEYCPINEKPACCVEWEEGSGENDAYDITIFLKE